MEKVTDISVAIRRNIFKIVLSKFMFNEDDLVFHSLNYKTDTELIEIESLGNTGGIDLILFCFEPC